MKRSNISARRDWGDEEIVKEPEKEGREGKGGGERRKGRRGEKGREAGREEVSWKPIEERREEALTGDPLSTFACDSSTLQPLSWHNYE